MKGAKTSLISHQPEAGALIEQSIVLDVPDEEDVPVDCEWMSAHFQEVTMTIF